MVSNRELGYLAHKQWEATRGDQNECDAERARRVQRRPADWWGGWLERSDEWRDEIGHTPRTDTAVDGVALPDAPRFQKTYCSQCGGEFDPGNEGYSRCVDHQTNPITGE